MINQDALKKAMSLDGALMLPNHLADKFDAINAKREAMIRAREITLNIVIRQTAEELEALDREASAVWDEALKEVGGDPAESYQVSQGVRPAVIVPQSTIDQLAAQQAAEGAAQVEEGRAHGPTHPDA